MAVAAHQEALEAATPVTQIGELLANGGSGGRSVLDRVSVSKDWDAVVDEHGGMGMPQGVETHREGLRSSQARASSSSA